MTQGYLELKTEPELLIHITHSLPEHLAQPVDMAKKLTHKKYWTPLKIAPLAAAAIIVIALVVRYSRKKT